MPKQVVVIGALDTKGEDFAFIKKRIEERGFKAIVVDVGVMGEPPFKPDVDADAVAKAGGESLSSLRAKGDKGNAMVVMTRGQRRLPKSSTRKAALTLSLAWVDLPELP